MAAKLLPANAAIFKHKHAPGFCIIDANEFLRLYENLVSETEIGTADTRKFNTRLTLRDAVISTITLAQLQDPCNSAYSVTAVAARKGYGPITYDIAMSMFGEITSDKASEDGMFSVSSAAKKVWDVYKTRQDVNKNPLDNIEDPKTPQKSDDCKVTRNPDSSLNFSYSLKGSIDISVYLLNAQKLKMSCNEILKASNLDKDDKKDLAIDSAITDTTTSFFMMNYGKIPDEESFNENAKLIADLLEEGFEREEILSALIRLHL
jgi:hypothetical protein